MMKKLFFVTMMLLAFVSRTWAQDEHLKVHFDFSQVEGN